MSATLANYLAFTAPINPPGAPVLTRKQVWVGLQKKVRRAEDFVGGAITSTNVLSESRDKHGREVVTREIVLKEQGRRMREMCTLFEPMKVDFWAEDGSKVQNIVSHAADGELYMTYVFEGVLEKDTPVETQKAMVGTWEKITQVAVESTIRAIREMVLDGRIQA